MPAEKVVEEKQTAKANNVSVYQKPERKTFTQPTGKLQSNNIGIKSTLDPPKHKVKEEQASILPEKNEAYSTDDLDKVWKEYAYAVKRKKRDSLYATLINVEYQLSSDHCIKLKLSNSVQATELDRELPQLLRFLRIQLSNTNIRIVHELEENGTKVVADSKAKFDKLAEENSSLLKFRKLFNLDIEF